ncbi:MAG TPA: hypothetical protein VE998_12730 [Terriglobales bacterium]|nr:hypothetical protein [Terriglobales bacterium]
MRLPHLTLITAALLMGVAVAALAEEPAHKPPQYYVFNLGSPGGGTAAAAASINNLNWIAGAANQPGDTSQHAELWLGAPFDLGTLGGPNSAIAWPNKNDRGELAGIAETADLNPLGEAWSCALANFPTITNHICLGFTWRDGVMTPLPTLGGYDGYAAGINNLGQVAGWAENTVHDPTCNAPQVLQFEAVVWGPEPNQVTELSPLGQDPDSAATAINDQGEVVGISGICSNAVGGETARHAVRWEHGHVFDIGNFDGGIAWNTPTAINNAGQVVGFANLPNSGTGFNPVGFIWSRGHQIQQLHPLAGDSNSWAWGINIRGQAVGQSFGSGARAFLYQDGVMYDLNGLLASPSSLQLLLANDINDRGEIAGFARDLKTGNQVAFLAIPVGDDDVRR